MKNALRMLSLLIIVSIVLALIGCSGGSTQSPTAAGADLAPAQVATVMYVQQWAQILWGLVTTQTGTQTPTVGDPIINPDGSVSQELAGADGTRSLLTVYPDGSATLEIEYPDGATQTVTQSPARIDANITTIDWQIDSSDGLTVNYQTVIDDRGTPGSIADDRVDLDGESTIPGGLTQEFTVVTDQGTTQVQSNQSDGSVFTMHTPLEPPDYLLPDFEQTTTGVYEVGDRQVEFALTTPQDVNTRWTQMSSDPGEGITGDFALKPDFSGSGEFVRNGDILALVTWLQNGETDVHFPTADSSDASPAGGAVDYLTHRWQTLAGLMGPGGGVASARIRGLSATETR